MMTYTWKIVPLISLEQQEQRVLLFVKVVRLN